MAINLGYIWVIFLTGLAWCSMLCVANQIRILARRPIPMQVLKPRRGYGASIFRVLKDFAYVKISARLFKTIARQLSGIGELSRYGLSPVEYEVAQRLRNSHLTVRRDVYGTSDAAYRKARNRLAEADFLFTVAVAGMLDDGGCYFGDCGRHSISEALMRQGMTWATPQLVKSAQRRKRKAYRNAE